MLGKTLPLGKGITYELFLKEKIQEEEILQASGSQISNSKGDTQESNEAEKETEGSAGLDQVDSLEENLQQILGQKMVG